MIVSSGEVRASCTSLSVMPPMPACSTRTRTSSWSSFSSSLRMASIEPRKSALRMTFSSAILALAAQVLQRDRACAVTRPASCCRSLRFSAISRATARSATTWNGSSALGTSSRPVMRTGHARPGLLDRPARGRRTWPGPGRRPPPHRMTSPRAQRALLDQQRGQHALVARDRCASRQVPVGRLVRVGLQLLQLGHQRRACRAARRCPCPLTALVSTNGTSPPMVSGSSSRL